ncbi:MAG: glycosyltransferase [Chitinophagaceae bacterium]
MTTVNRPAAKKRILFANFPADGHFNPLTGLAVHLVSLGYDVRWYTSKSYAPKLQKLNIHHYCFDKAIDVSDGNFDSVFPGRDKQTSQIAKLKFDLIHAFILRAPEYYADLQQIQQVFPFDLLIADCAFTGIPFVKETMKIPVVAIGVFPLMESSADLPPNGLGMEPSYSSLGRLKQWLLRGFANHVIFNQPNKVMHQLLDAAAIPHKKENVFDMLVKKADLLLQSGTPGFEYKRSDISNHVHFIGPLLPYQANKYNAQWYDQRLNRYKRVVLVTQGTVEKDSSKIIVPTLEAFKNSNTLVVCTTGGSQTAALRAKYPQSNIIIEDFIPFNDVMPYADVYITNGGYGGVMLGIENNLPLVVAGIHEGKNEICARIGYFKLGVNLKTEKPIPQQIRKAVDEVIANPLYKQNVRTLARQFEEYQPTELCAKHIARLFQSKTPGKIKTFRPAEKNPVA